jgi:pantothenate kinase
LLIKKSGSLFIIVAALFLVLSLIDKWTFIFHPFLLAIVVDLDEKTEQDRALLRKLQIDSEIESEAKNSLLRKSFGMSNRVSLNINNVSGRK